MNCISVDIRVKIPPVIPCTCNQMRKYIHNEITYIIQFANYALIKDSAMCVYIRFWTVNP